jgi:hypothetical protein
MEMKGCEKCAEQKVGYIFGLRVNRWVAGGLAGMIAALMLSLAFDLAFSNRDEITSKKLLVTVVQWSLFAFAMIRWLNIPLNHEGHKQGKVLTTQEVLQVPWFWKRVIIIGLSVGVLSSIFEELLNLVWH